MLIRKAFYRGQFAAVIVLPLWIVIARSLSVHSLGAQDLLIFLSWPVLAVALAVTAGLTVARAAVRSARAVAWSDVAVLSLWYAVAIAYGVFISLSSTLGAGLTGGLLALVSAASVAFAVWQLLQAARRRVETVFAGFDQQTVRVGAVEAGEYRATSAQPGIRRPDHGRGEDPR